MTKKTSDIYQLKVTLQYSKPPIWRRILVASDTTLSQLHDIIQVAMGWTDSHLHMFIINDQQFSTPPPFDPNLVKEIGAKSAKNVKLNSLITEAGQKFHYDYDFGDNWEHIILLEKILPHDPDQTLPTCIKGKRACPPEDVGGVWGYDSFLEASKDPKHPAHEDYSEWIDDDFDPDVFDLDETNKQLQLVR